MKYNKIQQSPIVDENRENMDLTDLNMKKFLDSTKLY